MVWRAMATFFPPPRAQDGEPLRAAGCTCRTAGHCNTPPPRGTGCGAGASVRLDLDNMPQPGGFMLIRPSRGGRARVGAADYIGGAPEWVTEVAATSANYDLHEKLQVYRRNGVRECIV